ncbi:FtsH-binding integral membrane protein [Bacillus horti]|uniref:FtsH-binding integral membrane protein n=1 Tax=Caldalkalibacillus horti TaxID=77523 RepID=A0ABT9VUY6_9BACI|nr:FtsH-binding integral membrane protein [Bacillus horti]
MEDMVAVRKKKKLTFQWVFYTYSFLMLLFYIAYVFITNDRFSKADQRMSGNPLSGAELENIRQSWMWTQIFENLFLVLFLLMCLVCIFIISYKKDRNLYYQFMMTNSSLILGIIALSFVFNQTTMLPIGNLLQIIFIPIITFAIAYFYLLWVLRKKRGPS